MPGYASGFGGFPLTFGVRAELVAGPAAPNEPNAATKRAAGIIQRPAGLKIAYPEKSTARPVIAVRIEHPFLMPVRHPDDADPMGTAR